MWRRSLLVELLLSGVLFAQAEASVSGRVVHATLGTPIAGAKVNVDLSVAHATTDADGNFKIERLKAGDHSFQADKEGFASNRSAPQITVQLRPGEELKGMLIRLSPEGVVSGVVMDAKGMPIEASVNIRHANSSAYFAMQLAKNGEFRFAQLAAGAYIVYAQALRPKDPQYALTYYPASLDASKASSISVGVGEERKSIEIVMQEIAWVRISGKFEGSCPTGFHCTASYRFANQMTTGMMRSAPLSENGDFGLHVPPGDLKILISAFPSGPGRQPLTLGHKDLKVVAEDVEQGVKDLLLRASQVYRVAARYEWAIPNSAALPTSTLMLNPIDGISIMQFAKPDGAGLLVSENTVAGRYAIRPMGIPEGTYVSKIYAGDNDITQSGLDLTVSDAPIVRVLLSTDGATLGGEVSGNDPNGSSGCVVILFPDTPHRPEQELNVRQASCDAQGGFQIRDIAPGAYSVRVRSSDKVSAPLKVRFEPKEKRVLPLARL